MSARIIVLDPEPVVRNLIADVLKRAGYHVEPVDTVPAAVDIIRKGPPDLILTNVYLPGITGHDAMRLLKGICPNLPILMVSGLPDSDLIREWAGRDGFDTFPKPFTAQALLKKVRSMLVA
jgi:CheY-like chemotaxis protein